MCKIASGNLLYSNRELSSVLCDDLDGWDGEEWEGGPRGRGYMYTYS